MDMFVSSKHLFGKRILELAKKVKSASEESFVEDLESVVQYMVSYLSDTVHYKNFLELT